MFYDISRFCSEWYEERQKFDIRDPYALKYSADNRALRCTTNTARYDAGEISGNFWDAIKPFAFHELFVRQC